MGTNSSRKKKYLTKQEIEHVLNKKESLKVLFDKMKNADGFFTIFELRQLTNGLIEEFILKKIIQICGSKEHRLTYWDFLYFYALLNISSSNIKLNFILDFIYMRKESITKEKYINKVKKYFYNGGILIKMLLNDDIINSEEGNNNKIKRDFVFENIIENFSEEIKNYDLFRDTSDNMDNTLLITNTNNNIISSSSNNNNNNNYPCTIPNKNIKGKEDLISESDNVLVLKTNINNNNQNNNNNSFFSSKEEESKNSLVENDQNANKESKVKNMPKIAQKSTKFDNLKISFNKMSSNTGVFPISLFEEMLKEINVIQSLIDVIGNYLRQKSQKTFISFELFKEILSIITIPNINIDISSGISYNKDNKNNDFDNSNEKSKEEIIDGLFTLFAYPNDYINKKFFFIFAKSTKPELSSNTINEWFNQYRISKYINKKKFKEIIEYILDELLESFEHIKYLPYIFFKVDFKNKRMEKNCIEVLLKNQSLNVYIQERLQYDNVFYIIDKEFWDKWNLYMNRLIKINNNDLNEYNLTNNMSINMANGLNSVNTTNSCLNKKNDYNISNIVQNANTTTAGAIKKKKSQLKNLKINTEKIADHDGRLKEGLVYLKDYIVLSQRIYDLFKKWYGSTNNIEIKRHKIYLDDDENDNDNDIDNNNDNDSTPYEKGKGNKFDLNKIDTKSNLFNNNINNDSSNKISISKIVLNKTNISSVNSLSGYYRNLNFSPNKTLKKNYSYLKGENYKTHQKFEIEIYPIFLLFFNFVDMQKKNCSSINQVVDNIKETITKEKVKYYQFSRKTKFIELLHTLQNTLKMPLTKKNARLWVYYQERFEISEFNDSLEKYGIINTAVIVLEINENNYWPSERLIKEPLNKIQKKNLSLVGLMNIGNTCYMNSILQIFLNNHEIKDIFLNELRTKEEETKFYEFIINKKKSNGELFLEFVNLLKEKYVKNKKTITPKKFKEICGQYNETFKGFEQQDAHDFYTFLVDNLHEDTNIKSNTNNNQIKEESDSIDTTEIELSNEYWANTIRNNASYIYGLFFGQLKSTLTCSECNKNKLKYENFSALELPIPEGGKIIIEIILFRLPCTLSPFYKIETKRNSNNSNSSNNNPINSISINNHSEKRTILSNMNNYQNSSSKPTTKTNKININNEEKEFYNDNNRSINISIKKKLKKIKNYSIGKYAIPNVSSPVNSERDPLNINIQNKNSSIPVKKNHQSHYEESNLNTLYFEKLNNINNNINQKNDINQNLNNDSSTICKDELISNALNLNIPIKLRIEIERNKKCKEIIEVLKEMNELELDKDSKYTEFVMISKNKYIKEEAIIDETFLSFEQLYVYELLNYEGIKKVFGYEDINNCAALQLNKQDVQAMIDIIEEEFESNNNLTLFSQNEKDSSSLNASSDNDLIINNSKLKINENNSINLIKEINNYNTNEILIQIIHGYKSLPSSDKDNDFNRIFNIKTYQSINTYKDFIILTSQQSIKPVHLYEMIWEKYMYFLDSPTKYESSLWWKPYANSRVASTKNLNNEFSQSNNNLNNFNIPIENNNYSPFTIKIIKKSTKSCIFCPWFRFCSGCILNPSNPNYLNLSSDILIIIDWKRDIIRRDMKESNILFTLNHSTSNQLFENTENEEEAKSIYDCLDLFTHEEILKNILCEKCNKKTNFKKRLEIDKFPKYLVLILKRFKYTSMFTTKIDSLIHFPVVSLDLTNYISQKEGKIKYDLFGVVNHVGGLTGGHYHCDIKQENVWIKYDDSYTCEYDKKIETPNAYLLVYKYCERGNIYNEMMRQEYKLNLIGLMDTAYKIYIKQYHFEHFFNYIYDNNNSNNSEITEEYFNDCEFYYGEPITVNGKIGYLINIYKKDDTDKVYIKIKINKGYYETNIVKKKIIKETLKLQNLETTDISSYKQNNDDSSRVFCGGCLIN